MVDAWGQLPLHKLGACPENIEERIELAKMVIPQTSNINQQDNYGQTPLLIAAGRGPTPEIIKLLLEVGATPNIPCEVGLRPIDSALSENLPQVVKILAPITDKLTNPIIDYYAAKMKCRESFKVIQYHLRFRRKRKRDPKTYQAKFAK